MKKLLLILSASLVMACAERKPNFQAVQYTSESPYNKDKTWSRVVDYLAQNGTVIKVIDKDSGIMTTETVDFTRPGIWTWETKDGVEDPNAFIILPWRHAKPTVIKGQWNVRIKENSSGGSTVSLNIVNLESYEIDRTGKTTVYFNPRSSHVFEKGLTDYLKNNQ